MRLATLFLALNLILQSWVGVHDAATNGTSTGTTTLQAGVREFDISWDNFGGERWHAVLAYDPDSTAFIYDAYVQMDASRVYAAEFDLNQVTNGETVIYGMQCNFVEKKWQYTVADGKLSKWVDSNVPCVWDSGRHRLTFAYHRNGKIVTYDWVAIDGVRHMFVNASGMSSFALGWGKLMVVNFQIDGDEFPGSTTAFLDTLTISHPTEAPAVSGKWQ